MNFQNRMMKLKEDNFLEYIEYRNHNEYLFMELDDFRCFSFEDRNWIVKRLYSIGDSQEGNSRASADKKRVKYDNRAKYLTEYIGLFKAIN